MKKFKLPRLLFYVFITTIFVVSLSLSKYQSSLSTNDSVRVALFANDVTTTYSLEQKIYPGSTPLIIPITITNKKDGEICDVSENYVIKINNNENFNIPLQYNLYKDNNCSDEIIINQNGYYEDTSFTFKNGIEKTNTYYLKVSWPSNANDSAYAFEIDYLIMKFIITQIN